MARRRPERRSDEANADAQDSSRRVDTCCAKQNRLCQREVMESCDSLGAKLVCHSPEDLPLARQLGRRTKAADDWGAVPPRSLSLGRLRHRKAAAAAYRDLYHDRTTSWSCAGRL